MKNIVAIDCETSGLDPCRHALLSVGAVTLAGDEFYRECLFDETKEVSSEAMEVNGLSLEPSGDQVFPEYAVAELCAWLRSFGHERWVVVGKNPQFDYKFLCAAGKLAGDDVRNTLSRRCLDMHALAYAWACRNGVDMAAPGLSSDYIYRRLGVGLEPLPHHALHGARVAMSVFRRLVLEEEA